MGSGAQKTLQVTAAVGQGMLIQIPVAKQDVGCFYHLNARQYTEKAPEVLLETHICLTYL